MYQNKLVTCIKVGGRILREQHGVVLVPFGAEYSILVKNLNTRRVKVKVGVDGTDATDGTWLVVAPNSSMELERFIRNGNWSSGNRFKFIERSGDIEAHRGIGSDDGLVRVEYAVEKRVADQPIIRHYEVPVQVPHYYPDPWYPRWLDRRRPYLGSPRRSGGDRRTSFGASSSRLQASAGSGTMTNCNVQSPTVTNSESSVVLDSYNAVGDAGITVAGGVSHQQFHAVQDFQTDASDVMVLTLRGMVGDHAITQPITVDMKLTCRTCGKSCSSAMAFCSSCGTALQLV